jgi:hypothetical protein
MPSFACPDLKLTTWLLASAHPLVGEMRDLALMP